MTIFFKEAMREWIRERLVAPDRNPEKDCQEAATWAYNWCKMYTTSLQFRVAALEQRIRELEGK